jgi:hypothetical protein
MRALLTLTPPTVVPKLGQGGTPYIRNTAGTLLASLAYDAHDVAADHSLLVVHNYAAHDDARVAVR